MAEVPTTVCSCFWATDGNVERGILLASSTSFYTSTFTLHTNNCQINKLYTVLCKSQTGVNKCCERAVNAVKVLIFTN